MGYMDDILDDIDMDMDDFQREVAPDKDGRFEHPEDKEIYELLQDVRRRRREIARNRDRYSSW